MAICVHPTVLLGPPYGKGYGTIMHTLLRVSARYSRDMSYGWS